nr:MAG TPA: hypothetical protein [Caudoviricetes sp.]
MEHDSRQLHRGFPSGLRLTVWNTNKRQSEKAENSESSPMSDVRYINMI